MRTSQKAQADNGTSPNEPQKAADRYGRIAALASVAVIAIGAAAVLGVTVFDGDRQGVNETAETSIVTETNEAEGTLIASVGDALPGVSLPGIERDTAPAAEVDAAPAAQEEASIATLDTPAPAAERFGGEAPDLPDAEIAAVQEAIENTLDPTQVRSITPSDEGVEIAETEEEVLALEEQFAAQGVEHFQIPLEEIGSQDDATELTGAEEATEIAALEEPVEPAPVADTVSAPASTEGLEPGWTTDYVNLRDGADNDSGVIRVVPADAEIVAETDCVHWCRSVYNGQAGYIYKTYIRRTAE